MLGLFVLIAYWSTGSFIAHWLSLPFPGSVVGLILLWLTLNINGAVPLWLKQPATLLIRYLTFLFVPACVGLMEHSIRLQESGLYILLAIALSSAAAILTMVFVFNVLGKKT